VQQILALRGRAYYLLKNNKATEARTKLIEAQDLNPLTSDGYRSLAATTLLDGRVMNWLLATEGERVS
jgi:hypothetical protein